jgi:hypothetical protein
MWMRWTRSASGRRNLRGCESEDGNVLMVGIGMMMVVVMVETVE